MNFLSDIKKIHFVGIGGIGMSAMAKYMRHHGITVTGSDLSESDITKDLSENYDIKVYIGALPENVTTEHNMIVYSPAVPEANIERTEGKNLSVPEYSYPELLGEISKEKITIAIAGTNGKTTTTTMVVEILKHLGIDPTAIIGEYMQKYNSNFVSGMSEYFVTEACEYKESFLHIQHDVLLITNITEDHLDYFDDLNHIKKAFESFLDNKKGEGILVCNTALPELFNTIEAAHALGMKVINYAKYLDDQLVLPIPGEHNRQNAAAALGIVEALDLSIEESRNYLARQFQGAKRRMEHVGMTNGGAQLFDDYAHNPEGLDYLVKGLREFYPEKQIVMLFEPHLYSRTRDFLKEFGQSLENVDVLYLFPTYRAREVHIPEEDYLLSEHISAEKVELIVVENKSRFKELFETKGYGVDTVVITVGAGDIWQQGLEIKKNN